MVCIISMRERPKLKEPVLIEGLPGIGFVANIAALHLIRELKAKLFAEVRCSSFQDFAVTAEKGEIRHPINELYFYNGKGNERDLIILYGNTQALTTAGQYELCGRILDISEEFGSRFVITIGGLKREQEVQKPKLYFAATDKETVNDLLGAGAEIIKGQIFGIAGLLVGIGSLRGFRGFSLLAETLGLYPDNVATSEVLKVICQMLNLEVNLDNLNATVEATRNLLENFGLVERLRVKRRKEESQFRWFV
ncbi:MAG: PAC2 family protein [Candidatus Bathyarchaeota archaeon]|nr:MAG: PAC2 family protein [Candidatus Bathyarchaeota archaeon]